MLLALAKKMHAQRQGFTLIELMVVVSIIALLSALAVTSVGGALRKARDARRKNDIKAIKTAMEFYYQENGFYPNTGSPNSSTGGNWLNGSANPVVVPKYMSQAPIDPVNNATYNFLYYIGSRWGSGYLIYTHLEDPNDPDLARSQACYGDTPDTCWGPDGYWYKVGK